MSLLRFLLFLFVLPGQVDNNASKADGAAVDLHPVIRRGGGSFVQFRLWNGSRHLLFIVVNVLFGNPLRLFRKQLIQFAHFGNLLFHASGPQVLFLVLPLVQKILTVGAQAAQQTITGVFLRSFGGFLLHRIFCGTQHFICTDFPLFLPVLFCLHTGAHEGNGFLPEDGKPPPHLHILKADGSPVIVHPVNLHPPPIHRKLHPQGDVIRRVAYFQDFIGGVGAVFRVRSGDYGAFAVFQQFF